MLCRPAFQRLPIRVRLTIAFAGVLTAVLGASGLVLYTEFERDLNEVIDSDLNTRAADMVALVSRERDPERARLESGERLAQIYSSEGRLLASTSALSKTRPLTRAEVREAARGRLEIDRADTPVGHARLLAVAAKAGDGAPVVVAVAEPLAGTDASLDRLRELLFIAGPLALLLATYAGYQVAGAACGPSSACAPERSSSRSTPPRDAFQCPGQATRSRRSGARSTSCSTGWTPQ